MILHVIRLDKFLPAFVELINENFDPRAHCFLVVSASGDYPLKPHRNVYPAPRGRVAKVWRCVQLFWKLQTAKKVVLHGLLDWRVIVTLALCPWVLRKGYWLMWGSDLYVHEEPKRTFAEKALEWCRRRVIRNVSHLVTYIPGDVRLARRWYGARGVHQHCLMYLSNTFQPAPLDAAGGKTETLNILVGNSANPSNDHLEVLDRLVAHRDSDIRIYAPLSYGDKKYAEKVARYGKKYFGDKFEPMFDFMSYHRYQAFLGGIDVAIFNHRRQQAMGNTIALLGAGKTVYLRRDMSHGEMLAGLGIRFFDLSEFSERRIPEEEARRNMEIIESNFSKERLVHQWAGILGGRHGVPDEART